MAISHEQDLLETEWSILAESMFSDRDLGFGDEGSLILRNQTRLAGLKQGALQQADLPALASQIETNLGDWLNGKRTRLPHTLRSLSKKDWREFEPGEQARHTLALARYVADHFRRLPDLLSLVEERLDQLSKHAHGERLAEATYLGARIADAKGDLHRALQGLRLALDISETPRLAFEIERTMTLTLWHAGQHERALPHALRAIELLTHPACEASDRERALAHLHIGLIQVDLGQVEEGGRSNQMAWDMFEKIGDQTSLRLLGNNQGTAFEEVGQWDQAIQWYEQGMQIDPDAKDAVAVRTLGNAIRAYCRRDADGDRQRAHRYYQEALMILASMPREGEAILLGSIVRAGRAFWLEIRDKPEEAIKYHQEAIELASTAQRPDYVARGHLDLARYLSKLRRTEVAAKHLRLARAIFLENGVPNKVLQVDEELERLGTDHQGDTFRTAYI